MILINNEMPVLGMGTFRLEGDVAYNSVKMALELGYRHIDTAQIYGNEAEVGQAIADSGVTFYYHKSLELKFKPSFFSKKCS